MKVLVNNTATTIVLVGGRVDLSPKGVAGKDRKTVSDDLADHPEIQRFAQLGKIGILSLDEAAQKDNREAVAKTVKAAAPVAPPAPPVKKEEPKPEPPKEEPKVTPEPPKEEPKPEVEEKEEEEDASDNSDAGESKSSKRRRKK